MNNQLQLEGVLTEKSILRYTPSGLPVLEFQLEHQSTQLEASQERAVHCTLKCLAIGPMATRLEQCSLGASLLLEGFLNRKSQRSNSIRFHVCGVLG
ncbi:MAG: primosomal replication protein N [Limnobacter sp.]|nr:primosomal replication protein N [Limnobacter sp.]